MILVDTSVWINYFNGQADEHSDCLDAALDEGSVAIGDLIYLEILQGFRTDRQYRIARDMLKALDHYTLLGKHMVAKCADNYRSLRKKGFTIRRTNDVVIATFCIEHQLPLLYSDRDFDPFVRHLGLMRAQHTRGKG